MIIDNIIGITYKKRGPAFNPFEWTIFFFVDGNEQKNLSSGNGQLLISIFVFLKQKYFSMTTWFLFYFINLFFL